MADNKAFSINATSIPYLILLIVTAISLVAVFTVTRTGPEQSARHYTEKLQQQTLAESTSNMLQQRINDTREQLAGIATSAPLIEAVRNQDEQKLQKISDLLGNSFSHTVSFRIIAWDHTATVGLRNRGIELRNNIELMMLTRAGGNRVPEPEAYTYDGRWLLSLAHPVIIDNEVSAIILLSLDEAFFHSALTHPLIRRNASVQVKHDQQGAVIFNNAQKPVSAPLRFDLPFSDGSIHIAASQDTGSGLEPVFLQFYLALAALGVLLILTILIAWFITGRSLKTDRLSIICYAESLTSLHATQPPSTTILVPVTRLAASDAR